MSLHGGCDQLSVIISETDDAHVRPVWPARRATTRDTDRSGESRSARSASRRSRSFSSRTATARCLSRRATTPTSVFERHRSAAPTHPGLIHSNSDGTGAGLRRGQQDHRGLQRLSGPDQLCGQWAPQSSRRTSPPPHRARSGFAPWAQPRMDASAPLRVLPQSRRKQAARSRRYRSTEEARHGRPWTCAISPMLVRSRRPRRTRTPAATSTRATTASATRSGLSAL